MHVSRVVIQGNNLDELANSAEPAQFAQLLWGTFEQVYFHTLNPQILVYSKEKYYYRIESNLLTTIILFFDEDHKTCIIDIVSGGGAAGLLFRISWWAESDRNKEIIQQLFGICEKKGWNINIEIK